VKYTVSSANKEAAIILAAVGQRYRSVIGMKPQITLMPANGISATLQQR
jgi:hypothetical protein